MGIPDDRCVGGRQSIELELYSMRKRVMSVKSSLNTRISDVAAKKIVPRKSPHGVGHPLRPSFELSTAETRETFRRVADVERSRKGGLQQPPKTLDVSKRMSANKKKKKEVAEATLSTHHNNVVNMYRRMESMGSVTERRKNHMDAELYPSYLRRRATKDKPSTLQKSTVSPATATRYSEFTDKRVYNITKAEGPSKTVPKYRPRSAPPLYPVRYSNPAPPTCGPGALPAHLQDVYREFYSALMEAIVAERMYQEGPLKKLFSEFLKSSAGSEMESVAERVIDDLKVELDVRD